MSWTPIVNKGFTAEAFAKYVKTISPFPWRPQFVVLHNTALPTLGNWHSKPGDVRLGNLATYYQGMEWHAGPHLFVADDLIWAFTPLWKTGVHSPSWNSISWGVETVGDFSYEEFKEPQKTLLVSALAALHTRAGLAPNTMKFHKEDPKTTHNCPGKNMKKGELIALTEQAMLGHPGEHDPNIDREV